MKRFLALALTLVMALSLTACGGKTAEKAPEAETPAATETDDGYHISVILKTSSSEYWQYTSSPAHRRTKRTIPTSPWRSRVPPLRLPTMSSRT